VDKDCYWYPVVRVHPAAAVPVRGRCPEVALSIGYKS
jgi:hypothetical protein